MQTIEFELPHGLEVDGRVHKHVVMRAPTNQDLWDVSKDADVRDTIKNNSSIPLQGVGGLFAGRAVVIKLQVVLFQRLIKCIGDIEKVNRQHLMQLDARDFRHMEDQYSKAFGDQAGGESDDGKDAATTAPFDPVPSEI